mmetsp:Transcript_8995/g.23559  ORF Transcript_8995/g.23559 Transcript_8995/m.23559 type:complete len:296 (-) Transcript_8995:115-1002(-)|eukprot:CAMPEP_0185838088 /NCGR_PEP_ID=MMETSP1353-20130828/12512_1 /TAXON_ID=1077150 /ORGANISM="Erythrolobus australicus, Strain CCMP3124" /LENGTH=295 /DNA_ID=CAMNT_0028537103 /DNA_START=73 /DNA_END=960 /DNA_ORIENTATION=-
MESIRSLTIERVVAQLPARQKMHALSIDSDVDSAFEYMDHEKIIVAPVRHTDGMYGSLVGVYDLVDYCVLQIPGQENDLKPESVPRLKHTLKEVLDSKPAEHFVMPHVKPGDSLAEAARYFAEGRHKVFVDANPPYLFSQHDLVSLLNAKPELVPQSLRESSVADSGFSPRPILSAKAKEPVIGILRELIRLDVYAVPLVDDSGMVIGNFSESDLKGMDDVMLQELLLPAHQFLSEENARGAGHPITVEQTATVGETIVLLAYSGAHRVWVVDEAKKAIGVVSMTDIISSLMSMI